MAVLASLRNLWDTIIVMSINVPQKKRGRPATGILPRVAVRLHPEMIARIDAYCDEHGLDRSGAIRRLVEKGLEADPPHFDPKAA